MDTWDKIWKDKKGKIVIWQTPNALLIGWAVLTIVSLLLSGHLSDVFAVAGLAVLIAWSLLEMVKGVNYFRRVLGLVILALAVLTLIKTL